MERGRAWAGRLLAWLEDLFSMLVITSYQNWLLMAHEIGTVTKRDSNCFEGH